MDLKALQEQQYRLLYQRIEAIERIWHGIDYTLSHLNLTVETMKNLDNAQFETLSALITFCKVQLDCPSTPWQRRLLNRG
jgi:hypothetical protein